MHGPASQDVFRIFGTDSGAHLAELQESIVPVLDVAQGKPAHGLRLLTWVRPIYPAEGKRFEQRFNYVERLSDRRPAERVALEFNANPGELVAVYRFKPYDSSWKGFAVTKDGAAASPAFLTFDSWM